MDQSGQLPGFSRAARAMCRRTASAISTMQSCSWTLQSLFYCQGSGANQPPSRVRRIADLQACIAATLAQYHMHRAPAVWLPITSVAADQRGAGAVAPQRFCSAAQPCRRGRAVDAILQLLLLQDSGPDLQEMLPRLVAQQQCRIQEEVPAKREAICLSRMCTAELSTTFIWCLR